MQITCLIIIITCSLLKTANEITACNCHVSVNQSVSTRECTFHPSSWLWTSSDHSDWWCTVADLAVLVDVANGRQQGEHNYWLANDDWCLMSQLDLQVLFFLIPVRFWAWHCGAAAGMSCRSHCLWFLATATFQRKPADRSGTSRPTFSRVMPDKIGGRISSSHLYIKFSSHVGWTNK